MPSHPMTSSSVADISELLPPCWRAALANELVQPYMAELKAFLEAELADGKSIYPPPDLCFAAFDRTPLDRVKVVILGQDPYHGPGQAHGLSFSVPHGRSKPPSLRNILKELASDLGDGESSHGCLETWADQGVLLLNSVLTVENSQPGSHAERGWERFTDAVVRVVSDRCEPTVFVLWGGYARSKAAFVDGDRHLVLEATHPSPRSALKGFFGSRPFSKVNTFLRKHGRGEINWRLPG